MRAVSAVSRILIVLETLDDMYTRPRIHRRGKINDLNEIIKD